MCPFIPESPESPCPEGFGAPEPLRTGGQQLQLDIHPSIPQECTHDRIPLNPETASRRYHAKSDFLSIPPKDILHDFLSSPSCFRTVPHVIDRWCCAICACKCHRHLHRRWVRCHRLTHGNLDAHQQPRYWYGLRRRGSFWKLGIWWHPHHVNSSAGCNRNIGFCSDGSRQSIGVHRSDGCDR